LLTRQILAWAIRWLQARPHKIQHVVIVGLDPSICAELGRRVEACEDRCYRIVAFFGCGIDGTPQFKDVDSLLGYLTHNAADVVLFASAPEKTHDVKQTVASILELGISVSVLQEFYSLNLIGDSNDVTVRLGFAGLPIVQFQTVREDASYLFVKRLFDIVCAAAGLLVLSPIFLVIGSLVKATSRGPIFYPWKVLGQNRRRFVGYKFRTMVPDADEMKGELMKFNEMSGPVFKMRDDPRITPIGRWLRKYSLDEFPQLYSVLKGDMSLVGPRPPSQAESDRFEFWQHRKLSVKPGITCLWQISGRNKISDFSEWARLDLQYIKTASFALDMMILLRTVPVVLIGHGAY
jgi:exopolysaccharide biosynthesis polyprenyl glycosylphosphotransferase